MSSLSILQFAKAATQNRSIPLPWSPTDPKNMSPCPAVNSLANHGILPRTNITAENIAAALEFMGLDKASSNAFATPEIMNLGQVIHGIQMIDLKDLATHGLAVKKNATKPGQTGIVHAIEHDASLTRSDFNLGNNFELNYTLYTQLKSLAVRQNNTSYLTNISLANARKLRERHSLDKNPEFLFGTAQQASAYTESALISRFFSDKNGNVPVKWLDLLFTKEKLPIDQGWFFRNVSRTDLFSTSEEIFKLAHPTANLTQLTLEEIRKDGEFDK